MSEGHSRIQEIKLIRIGVGTLVTKDVPQSLQNTGQESLVKSKKRVADHGEVFTPSWLVTEMLKQVADETQRIDSKFLEPACGSGNFLTQVLKAKLEVANRLYSKNRFELEHFSLLGLMSVYGIELLPDNAAECRTNLLRQFQEALAITGENTLSLAASAVLEANIVNGDALTMKTTSGQPIVFAEWGYLGRGKFNRRDFAFDVISQMSSFAQEDSLFSNLGRHEIFTPLKHYPPLSIGDLADGLTN